ncbi:MAG: hypothetical protein COA52_00865 [Hyphomicrobiales bacterium]|nr:MAG: hypothetical protein COA52_00865 [Hyphomicrobiales bacterium]
MARYNFVYKVTNLVNGKIYIGKRSTNDLNDGYLGSGLLIKKAILKYGKENFKREIISFHDTSENALKEEEKIVDEEFIRHKRNYNLCVGGKGTWPPSALIFTKERREKISKSLSGRIVTEDTRNKLSKNISGENNPYHKSKNRKNPMQGKKHSLKTKEIMSKKSKKRLSNKENHPMFNKCHSIETKKKIADKNRGLKHSENSKNKRRMNFLKKFGVENISYVMGKQVLYKGKVFTAKEWSNILKCKYSEIGYKAHNLIEGFSYV